MASKKAEKREQQEAEPNTSGEPTQLERAVFEADTLRHIRRVQSLLNKVVGRLLQQAEVHDASKFSPEESNLLAKASALSEISYDSDEYRRGLEELQPALDHHYSQNRHHPEYWQLQEIWRPVVGFESSYEVSSFGNVRSQTRTVKRPGPTGDLYKKSQMLRQNITPKGYRRLQLQDGDRRKNAMVHRLVAEAFVPNPDDKPIINHIDGNKVNNRVENLEWATHSENVIHAYENELRAPAVKYVVTCEELGITTLGCAKMEEKLRQKGHEKARASAIWSCIAGKAKTHLDLTFTAINVETAATSPVDDMNLLDVVEMLCDWMASSERQHNGNLKQTLEENAERFGISPQLAQILMNTIQELEDE